MSREPARHAHRTPVQQGPGGAWENLLRSQDSLRISRALAQRFTGVAASERLLRLSELADYQSSLKRTIAALQREMDKTKAELASLQKNIHATRAYRAPLLRGR